MILLTGATGYVGHHLLSALIAQNRSVRCLARDISALPEAIRRDSVQGDALDVASLRIKVRAHRDALDGALKKHVFAKAEFRSQCDR